MMATTRRDSWQERWRPGPPLWSALALLTCLGLLAIVFGGIFTVRQVQVVGSTLPRGTITDAAGVGGQNIFTVQSDAIVARLSQIPEIAVRRVATSFPDTVTIYLRMRVPFVAWQDGSTLYQLDSAGRIIGPVPRTTLPVVVGTDGHDRLSPGVVQAVRYAVHTLPPLPRGAIASFHFQPSIGLTITGRTGWTAYIGRGNPQSLTNRIALLASFLSAIRHDPRHLQLVDVRLRVPYARYAGPTG